MFIAVLSSDRRGAPTGLTICAVKPESLR